MNLPEARPDTAGSLPLECYPRLRPISVPMPLARPLLVQSLSGGGLRARRYRRKLHVTDRSIIVAAVVVAGVTRVGRVLRRHWVNEHHGWKESVRIYLHHLENRSPAGHLIILWRTVRVVVKPVGAH